MKPIIGINCSYYTIDGHLSYKLNYEYVEAIRRAGGIPIILPIFQSEKECQYILNKIDGLLLSGGADINPDKWGEKKHPKTNLLHPDKEKSDFMLVKLALKSDMPILGICYGMQLINVVLGGSLHQHIPDIKGCNKIHSQENQVDNPMHQVEIKDGSGLSKIFGSEAKVNHHTKGFGVVVNSFHHQAIKDLGKGLVAIATANDGIIEAIESKNHKFVLGVQWHPERMLEDKKQLKLFEKFVQVTRY